VPNSSAVLVERALISFYNIVVVATTPPIAAAIAIPVPTPSLILYAAKSSATAFVASFYASSISFWSCHNSLCFSNVSSL